MYADFSTGIIVGLLCAVFISSILWGVLFHQVREMRSREYEREIISLGMAAVASHRREREET